jgi:hypothetical protein
MIRRKLDRPRWSFRYVAKYRVSRDDSWVTIQQSRIRQRANRRKRGYGPEQRQLNQIAPWLKRLDALRVAA